MEKGAASGCALVPPIYFQTSKSEGGFGQNGGIYILFRMTGLRGKLRFWGLDENCLKTRKSRGGVVPCRHYLKHGGPHPLTAKAFQDGHARGRGRPSHRPGSGRAFLQKAREMGSPKGVRFAHAWRRGQMWPTHHRPHMVRAGQDKKPHPSEHRARPGRPATRLTRHAAETDFFFRLSAGRRSFRSA